MEEHINQTQPESIERPRSNQQFQNLVVFLHTHKTYQWIARIFFILIIGVGIFFAFTKKEPVQVLQVKEAPKKTAPSPQITKEPNSNWKTYTDNPNGFLFRYPSTLTLVEANSAASIRFTDGKQFNFTLEKHTGEESLDLKEWIYTYALRELPSGKKDSIITEEISPFAIKGVEALTFTGEIESENKYVVLRDKTAIYVFILSGSGTGTSYKENKAAEPLFNQILATVTFVNKIASPSPLPISTPYQIISTTTISPDQRYTIGTLTLEDYYSIEIADNRLEGSYITTDLVGENKEMLLHGKNFNCSCTTYFKGWYANNKFIINILNEEGEEYEYIVSISETNKAIVNEESLIRIR